MNTEKINNMSIDTTNFTKEIWNKPEIEVINIKEITLNSSDGVGSDDGFYESQLLLIFIVNKDCIQINPFF